MQLEIIYMPQSKTFRNYLIKIFRLTQAKHGVTYQITLIVVCFLLK